MLRLFTTFISLFIVTIMFAQEQPPQKSPEEYAAIETERLIEELELNAAQIFYVDSTLQADFKGVMEEFEKMKVSGMQNSYSYETVRDKWADKTLASFKKILTEQQYIKYLKSIGKGKEYKRGKDGQYYLKEDKKKKKKDKK